MNTPEAGKLNSAEDPAPTAPTPAASQNPYSGLAAFVAKASSGDRATLARLDPDRLQPQQLAALSRALLAAGLDPTFWRPATWPRWALVAHGIALAGHRAGQLGSQLAEAGVSESRVTKLLTARGAAFRQLLPRILRLLASKGESPNWRELGELVIKESSDDREDLAVAETLRLRIAGAYFSHLNRSSSS
jgi:CRISPR system Cascade subunit CasB